MPQKTRRKQWPNFAEWARKESIDLSIHSSQVLAQANRLLLMAVERLGDRRPAEAEALVLRAMHLLSESRVDQERIRRYLTEAREGRPSDE